MSFRVLLVDDDPIAQALFRGFLEARGYLVDAAGDGMSGIKLLNEHSYDLALIDFHLPEIDGLVSARMMRNLTCERDTRTKFVAITADREGLASRPGAETVFDGVLTKPIDAHGLLAFVGSILEARPVTASADAAAALLQAPQHHARGKAAATAFWRARGLAGLPRAAVLPRPGPEAIAALSLCFDICAPEVSDIILIRDRDGLADLAALRRAATPLLTPAVDAGAGLTGAAEAAFRVNEPECWSQIARLIKGFEERRMQLLEGAATADPDARVLAYLYLAARPLRIVRGHSAAARVLDSGGFDDQAIAASAVRLAAAGLLTCRTRAPESAVREGEILSVYEISERGIATLTSCALREATHGGPPRILVAVESSVNRDITARMLESGGHVVEVVASGPQAVSRAIRGPCDVMLLDAQMTGLADVTAIREIRGSGARGRRLPIIALSANASPEAVAALRKAGFDSALARPFRREDVLAAVREVCAATAQDDFYALAKFDRGVFDGLLEFLDWPGRDALLADFETQLSDLYEAIANPVDHRLHLAVAHATISAAGMLGFVALSEACRSYCDRCRDGGDAADCADLREVCGAALRCIADIRGPLGAVAAA